MGVSPKTIVELEEIVRLQATALDKIVIESKYVNVPKVSKAYKVATGKCTILRPLIQKRPGQVCLSKIPVTQCGPSCKPQKSQLTLKAVPFTCLKEGPVVEKLVAKVTSFTAQVRMPSHCVHALVSKGI